MRAYILPRLVLSVGAQVKGTAICCLERRLSTQPPFYISVPMFTTAYTLDGTYQELWAVFPSGIIVPSFDGDLLDQAD